MEIYEIAAWQTGVSQAGVNFLQPADSFQNIENGLIYRQELKSRLGFTQFSNSQLDDQTRVMGIFESILPDATTQLLVCTKQFLYKYNSVTNHFDQITNAGSAPIGGFGIVNGDSYVSGTNYPTKSNGYRFIFTSSGMADTYFYDGINVKSFTQDNPDYQAPASGTLRNAQYVIWFGERLNFGVPYINSIAQNQQVLFSAIRDSSGNGDKFNVPGSGSISADTFEYMTGFVKPGDYLVLEFNRSTYTLEKTRDAFNPYFIRKIPSVLGTDANFSAVSWNNQTMSAGKTGYLITDGRESLRRDNKIPYFTALSMDAINFNYTYGGFDRINAQFIFAFRSIFASLTEITQDQVLAFNYEEHTWSVNDERFSVFGQSDIGLNLAWNDIYEVNNPSWLRMDTTEEIWNQIGLGQSEQKSLAGDNNGFVYEINQNYNDYMTPILNITQAASAVVTISAANFRAGDLVQFANVQGMTEINGLVGEVLSATLTSITVDINTLAFTPYVVAGSVSKLIEFSANTIPFNPYRSEGRKVRVSHLEFLVNSDSDNLLVSIYEDDEESAFKSETILAPYPTTKQRQWRTCIVDHEANFMTFQMEQKSANTQIIIYSMRIHAERGKMTNG